MTRKKLILILLGAIVSLPIFTTFYLSFEEFGNIYPESLLKTQLSNPRLWILDIIPVAFSFLVFVFRKVYIISLRPSSLKKPKTYRVIGLSWGIFVYLISTISLIAHDHGNINFDLFITYHKSHPIVLGLVATIPFFFALGYLIEKLLLGEKRINEQSKELSIQNQLLKKEITSRKAREAELIEARKEALAGVKAKDHFLSNMSHEIRTPMNGVIGLINLLQDSDLSEEQRKYASAIDYSAKNLLVLINQILDLSKINSEKLTLEHINFNLRESIQVVEESLKPIAIEKGIVLRTIIDSDVPQIVCGDPVRLNQILLNLAGNAVKFTEEGGVDIIVKSRNTDDGIRLSIQVNDTGIGIPKDKLDHIFETFTQASSETTRKYGGSGLGLAISRELIELFGGSISIESQIGKGSSFQFEVQLKKETATASHFTNKTQKECLKNLDLSEIRVLLAEDNSVNQLVAKSTLVKKGFQVDIAQNGQEVIERIFQKKFDVILMDVQMPIMNGLDATRFIRNATKPPLSSLKIIALTASAMKEDIERCYAAGMDDYLSKPFQAEDLLIKLNKHLTSK